MSKTMDRRSFLKSAATGALGLGAMVMLGGSASASETASAIYTPGVYTAVGTGYGSDVTVTVTFDETHITNVVVDASGETATVGAAAGERLAEQVLAAQSSAIDGVTGATATSKAVKAAVADCIAQASGGAIVEGGDVAVADAENDGDWLGQAPEIDEADIAQTLETEVLVVGAGNAGLMAAARAASQGAKVLVIEKAISGMNERHWIGAIGSAVSKEAGVTVDKDKLVAELCRYASHRCDERLIRLWADNSGEMVDWYADVVSKHNEGVKLHMEWDVGEGGHDTYYVAPTMHNFQDDIPEHDYSPVTSAYGFASLIACMTENGGEIRYETTMEKLERQAEGRVTGIIAKAADGSHLRINASKGVLLCCGGYASNRPMLATLNPVAYQSTVSTSASALDVGDGIRAALWVGADKDTDATTMLFDRGGVAPDHVADGTWDKSGYFHLGSQPWLKVNLKGERFCNESVPYDFILHAASLEPGHLYNTIYDSNWEAHVKQFKQIGCARIEPSQSGGKLQIFSWEAEKGLLAGLEKAGFVQRADTLEELAQKLNMPVDRFVATVKRYNELCAKGVDEDFGKEAYRLLPVETAPFYGCRQGANILCTLDGLRINTDMQVLDTQGEPIPGLYAAGDCSGGFFAHNYPEYVVGVAVGRSLTEGYLVGTALAQQ